MLTSIQVTDAWTFGAKAPPVALAPLTLMVGANGVGKSNFMAACACLARIAVGNTWTLRVPLVPGRTARWTATWEGGDAYAVEVREGPDGRLQKRASAFAVGTQPFADDAPFVSMLNSRLVEASEIRACRELGAIEIGGDFDAPMGSPARRDQSLYGAHRLTTFSDATRAALDTAVDRFADGVWGIEAVQGELYVRTRRNARVPATHLSDGVWRFLGLALRLLGPSRASLLGLETPERDLHPDALPLLAELLRTAAAERPVLVTTHSETLLDCFTDTPEVVCVAARDDESTTFRRVARATWPDELSLGAAWRAGHFGVNRW